MQQEGQLGQIVRKFDKKSCCPVLLKMSPKRNLHKYKQYCTQFHVLVIEHIIVSFIYLFGLCSPKVVVQYKIHLKITYIHVST